MNTSEFAGREALANSVYEIPESEYTRRLGDRQRQLAGIRALHRRLWTYLILAALAGTVVTWAALSSPLVSILWILLPAVVALSIVQSLTRNARLHARVQRIVSFYEIGLGRLGNEWQGRGIGGANFRPESHP
jgi:Flp pilus assembly protein TadB